MTHAEHPDVAADRLRQALLDSRQRWRDLVTIAADIAFETDREGRFTFIMPETPLGWTARALIGMPAEDLLAPAGDTVGFNPFRATAPLRGRLAWLRRSDGSAACLSFAVAPLLDDAGGVIGLRGLAVDASEQNRRDADVADALRRGEVLSHILSHMRRDVLAQHMMRAAVQALLPAVGADGGAVLDLGAELANEPPSAWRIVHVAGDGDAATLLAVAGETLTTEHPGHAIAIAPDGRRLLACAETTRFGERAALLLWRRPEARPWEDEERAIAAAAAGMIRVALEHDALQREMARQARTDPLTGLLNRRAFLEEVERRIDRLERDGMPGTLFYIDLDQFKALNDRAGHDTGDEALCVTTSVLLATFRAGDVVARLGGDEFAVWLDGTDDLAAAERAERLRNAAPRALADVAAGSGVNLTMSIGIACRWPGTGEDLDSVLRRADMAMYEVKRAGRGHWRVAQADAS